MFHAYSGIFTKLHISRHIWDSDICKILALPVQSNVKQHLLIKSGSSFESLFRSIWNIFLQDSISILRITIIIACNPRYHTTHPTHANTPLTPPTLTRHLRKHATHTTHASTPPALARIARHFSNS